MINFKNIILSDDIGHVIPLKKIYNEQKFADKVVQEKSYNKQYRTDNIGKCDKVDLTLGWNKDVYDKKFELYEKTGELVLPNVKDTNITENRLEIIEQKRQEILYKIANGIIPDELFEPVQNPSTYEQLTINNGDKNTPIQAFTRFPNGFNINDSDKDYEYIFLLTGHDFRAENFFKDSQGNIYSEAQNGCLAIDNLQNLGLISDNKIITIIDTDYTFGANQAETFNEKIIPAVLKATGEYEEYYDENGEKIKELLKDICGFSLGAHVISNGLIGKLDGLSDIYLASGNNDTSYIDREINVNSVTYSVGSDEPYGKYKEENFDRLLEQSNGTLIEGLNANFIVHNGYIHNSKLQLINYLDALIKFNE